MKRHALFTPVFGRLDPAHHAPADANGLASMLSIHRAFTAEASGLPDDLYIWTDAPYEYPYVADFVPYNIRIIDVIVKISAAIGGAAVQLRDDIEGGGDAKSEAFDAASTGTKRESGSASYSFNQGDQLVVRRSDNRIAGEIFILFQRI